MRFSFSRLVKKSQPNMKQQCKAKKEVLNGRNGNDLQCKITLKVSYYSYGDETLIKRIFIFTLLQIFIITNTTSLNGNLQE